MNNSTDDDDDDDRNWSTISFVYDILRCASTILSFGENSLLIYIE